MSYFHRGQLIALACCILFTPTLLAQQGLMLGYGKGEARLTTWRLALVQDLYSHWLERKSPRLGLYADLSANLWRDETQDCHAFALSPVITWRLNTQPAWPLALEMGVGAAYLQADEIGTNKLGGHFQFEDRLGLALRHSSWGLALRAYHYSNAKLHKDNDGLNMLQLQLSWFPGKR